MSVTALSVDIYFENSSLSDSTRSSYANVSQSQSVGTFPNGISPTHSPHGRRLGKQNLSDSEIDNPHRRNDRKQRVSFQQRGQTRLDDEMVKKNQTPQDEVKSQSSMYSSGNSGSSQTSSTKNLSSQYLTESEVKSRNLYYWHVNGEQPEPLNHPDRHTPNSGHELAIERVDPRSSKKDNSSKIGMLECTV